MSGSWRKAAGGLHGRVDGSDGAVRHSGGHLAHLLDPDVAGGVYAGDGGLHLFVGGDVAVFQSQLSEQLRIGNHAGIHEDHERRQNAG